MTDEAAPVKTTARWTTGGQEMTGVSGHLEEGRARAFSPGSVAAPWPLI
jgi:hypothetical protein